MTKKQVAEQAYNEYARVCNEAKPDLWSPPFKSLDPYVREAWIAAVDVILGFEYTFEVTEEVRRNLIEAAKNLEIVRPNKGQTP